MPTTLPATAPMPGPGRRALLWGGVLAGMLALPILGMLVLEGVLAARCTTTALGEGILVGKTLWRIERRDCTGAKAPFYDVQIGVEGKTMSTALTGRGEPYPVAVEFVSEGKAQVRLSGPLPGSGATTVGLGLRRSGSPSERIDLERLTQPGTAGGAR